MIEGIDKILNSDLLQRYITGDVTPTERIKVDMLRVDYREIRERLKELEYQLEQDHISQAITPPEGTKDCVIKALNPEAKTGIPKTSTTSRQLGNKSWLAVAASFLVGAAVVGFTLTKNNRSLQKQNTQLSADLTALTDACNIINEQYAFINAPETTPIVLENINSGDYQAVVYWNDTKQASYLRCLNLPKLDSGKTYQIWADVNHKMLSLGTFSSGKELIALGYYDHATSLNITVEPWGGSDQPTLETLTAVKTI